MNSQHACTQVPRRVSGQGDAIILALEGYRRVWQETADGASLLNITASVGLVIADIAEAIGLTSQERSAVLGEELDAEVSQLADQRVQLKQ